MKRVILLALLLSGMLTACGQEEATQAITPIQESEIIPIIQTSGGGVPTSTSTEAKETENGVFRYEATKYADRFAVDENGVLYIITCNLDPEDMLQTIKIFDWDGNCIEKQELKLGVDRAKELIVGENHLYLLIPEADCANVLYQINITTWEVKRLYAFTEFKAVFDLTLLGDTLYVLGEYENYKEKEFLDYQDWYATSNGREYMVAYLQVTEERPELAFVPFDLPMYIFALDEETLCIYGKEERYKYRLFAYSLEDHTVQGISVPIGFNDFICSPFQYYEDGMFMVYDSKNIYFVNLDGTEHEIGQVDDHFYVRHGSVAGVLNRKIVYANGCLFHSEYNRNNITKNVIQRINIEDKLQEIQSE